MRKTLQRRPGFEVLESMTLLSGLAGAAVSTPAPNPIHLTGSIGMKIKLQQHPVWDGAGSISPLGHVTGLADGSLGWAANVSFILKTKTGNVFGSISPDDTFDQALHSDGKEGDPMGFDYTIIGGTKAYAGATGSGYFQFAPPRLGRITATFS
jgi:hypothetical protein